MRKILSRFKHPQHTFKKRSVYYYSRAIPKDLSDYYTTSKIVFSLRTKSFVQARVAAKAYSAKLEQYWFGLRLQNIDVPALSLMKPSPSNCNSALPTITEAKELYFSVKGKGRPKLFFDTASRNIKYLIDCLGVRPIDEYTSKDASQFREWLMSKGLSNSSLKRIFAGVKAVINFTILEQGLECRNAFSNVYIPANDDSKKRHAVKTSNLIKIKHECEVIDDDIRWLVALILDSGMRLSEAVGLKISDMHLDSEIPHIKLKPHPHRRLKTRASERVIPLVGSSLWAAIRIKETSDNQFCFPRYVRNNTCSSNSASAALNKWLKSVGGKDDVIHGLRHSYRDRLRAIEAPSDMIDQLGGWSLSSVGEGYGDGYPLKLLSKYTQSIAEALESPN